MATPDKVTASPTSSKDTKQALRCPRCDSANTKFCYYNNYSLSQPRHFCKTCRRYWTQGGALRNVPVGGGCRKNKKIKSSSSSSSSGATAMDFGLPSHLYSTSYPFGTNPNPSPSPNPNPSFLAMGLNQDMGHVNFVHQSSSLASSIESLSCINQDMHWKLQQQRLSVFFATDMNTPKQAATVAAPRVSLHNQLQDPLPMEGSREEWFFVNSGASVNPNLTVGGGYGEGNPNWCNGVQPTWSTLP